MSVVELTEFIVKSLVKNTDNVSVKEFETDEEDTVQIEIMVPASEMPKLIGKDGNMINSIRTIVQASSYLNGNKKIKINVDSY